MRVWASTIRSIPLEESKSSPLSGSRVIPIRNGGSRKGRIKSELTAALNLEPRPAMKFPIGYPRISDAIALTTAMKAVVENSSRLVVKYV